MNPVRKLSGSAKAVRTGVAGFLHDAWVRMRRKEAVLSTRLTVSCWAIVTLFLAVPCCADALPWPKVFPEASVTPHGPSVVQTQEITFRRFLLASDRLSGIPVNDRIPVTFVQGRASRERRTPGLVLLHALGEPEDSMMRRMARFFARRGISSAIIQLPYHMLRQPPGVNPLTRFAGRDVVRAVQAYEQSAADVSTVVTWLRSQDTVDPDRIGVMGISLGAIVAHLAMGLDDRLSAGVAVLGGGGLEHIYRKSWLPAILYPFSRRNLTPEERDLIRRVDPLTYADRNRPRGVLMIQAARDVLIPPSAAESLRHALGDPPIIWLDSNHYAPVFAEQAILDLACQYLKGVWGYSEALRPGGLPAILPPLIKIGALTDFQGNMTPALRWQVFRLGMRKDHIGLLHGDIGWSGMGPVTFLGATLNAHLDLGLLWRPGSRGLRACWSLHVAL